MQPLFDYILKLSVSLAIVYLFYQLVLRKLTFYNWNRWYLLGYTAFAFLIPLLNITDTLDKNNWNQSILLRYIPVIEVNTQAAATEAVSRNWQALDWLFLLLLAGMLVLMIKFVIRYLSFLNVRRNATLLTDGDTRLYMVEKDIIPFSFGNSIFINNQLQDEAELKEIIRHEFVHVKQKHTHDIVWSELLCILNWYNPFVWLIRKAIRQNLEFIADNKVLEQGLDRKKYQYLLLKVTGNNHFSIANQFNFSSLKKRIAMMNKMKSARAQLIKFLFIVPLIAVMLLAFRNDRIKGRSQDRPVYSNWQTGKFTDSVPDVEINGSGYYLDVKGKDGECIVLVRDKNRKEIERVPLTKWNENKELYGNKYGEIPPPPPPQPPVPPVPPAGPYLPEHVKSVHVDNQEATILLKDGTREKYDLNNKKERENFHKKYGKYLTPPPPPMPQHLHADGEHTIHAVPPVTVIDHSNVHELGLKSDVTVAVGTTVHAPVLAGSNVYPVTPAIANSVSPVMAIETSPKVATVTSSVGFKPTIAVTKPVGVTVESPVKLAYTPTAPVSAGVIHNEEEEIVLEFKIHNTTKRERLSRMMEEAKAKDIRLEFDEMKFDKDNKLVRIAGLLSKTNSKTEFSITDFDAVVLQVTKQQDGKYQCRVFGTTDKEGQ
jgi:beta-lactamase regulating signal transducer with metallopeptidase domain